jgi:ribulose kinase
LKPKPPATGAIELTGAEGEPGSYEKTLVSSDQPSDGTLTVGAAVTPVVAKSVHSTSTAKKRPSTASKKKRIEELIERVSQYDTMHLF